MPLTRRGSVSARLRVRFSSVSAARKPSRSVEKISTPPGSIARRALLATHHVQRRAPLAAGLSQHQRAGWKIEERAAHCGRRAWPAAASSAAGRRSSGAAPARDRPSTPIAMRLPMRRSSRGRVLPSTAAMRRVHRAQRKDAGEPHLLERLAEDARLERGDVGGDVGQFRHCSQTAAGGGVCATTFLRESSYG